MSYKDIPPGINPPDDFYSIIEIPQNIDPVKYEMNKEFDSIFIDRFLTTSMFYPANYGYIPKTLSEDGDPLDVLVISPYPVAIGAVIRSRPVGVMYMEDEHGIDAKIIAVPHTKLSKLYDHILDINDVDQLTLNRIHHFFEHYKDLEEGKWVKLKGWGNVEKAREEILSSIQAYPDHH
ncbi:inorganic pyrophosphatase [Acinetobacter sp. 1130196]|uniref:Inorganic pyrophosphatase n=1 Tax=Acinetobacter baumannii (strain 1295743) TaxID=1310613 RepID=A0A009HV35_ACIB9|nr:MULTISPECIES: inorganic diphosphatase [Acinetobacter]EXG35050.1 inorganic pyrophosphatase [Acinetobacter baumannii 121738]EKU6034787.1 inorganic diphosphatase [Acinetobacter nosocomialis]EKW2153388.1 inorganic diphosphatase [Acinetobacter baumannii]EXB06875.1 inorganic pyrophosphatase [Acinetobacter baumannii 1295743]EXB12298.1 inorganic pyrophosphatase [Acinetobacter sp. 1396970]